MSVSNKLVLSGDVVGFSIRNAGMLSASSIEEPPPEDHERVSQLRVSNTSDVMANDFTRCMFKIVSDNQVMTLRTFLACSLYAF